MNAELAEVSAICSPDIWELTLFLWTSADWPAWNDVIGVINLDTLGSVHSSGED